MNLSERDLLHVWHPCTQMKDHEKYPPIPIVSGKGIYLYDDKGKQYMDVISSWWCNLLGHCNPTISSAIAQQLTKLEHVIFADFTHEGAVTLCERLYQLLPKGLEKFNFSDNGSAAVECALKMAFQYCAQTGKQHRTKFMCLSGGYHGETIGALSVGGLDMYASIYKPMLLDCTFVLAPDCYRCPHGLTRDNCSCQCFNMAENCFEQHAQNACAIIIEPLLQGSAGMKMYPPLYLKKLRKLCTDYDVLLIADEIATGFGRTGEMFAVNHAQITPDIMCVSKGLTGGYLPMAITITTQKIYNAFYADYSQGKAFMHSHTYSGNPLGCAAANAVLTVLSSQNILAECSEKAKYFSNLMQQTFSGLPNVGEVRCLGLINAVELVKDKKTKTAFNSNTRIGHQIYKVALDNGLLLRPLNDILYLNPPLTITLAEIDIAVKKMHTAITDILK